MHGYQDIEELSLYQQDVLQQKTAARRRDAVLRAVLFLLIIGIVVFLITGAARGMFNSKNNDEPENDLSDVNGQDQSQESESPSQG